VINLPENSGTLLAGSCPLYLTKNYRILPEEWAKTSIATILQ
jgi:hypothetical protein